MEQTAKALQKNLGHAKGCLCIGDNQRQSPKYGLCPQRYDKRMNTRQIDQGSVDKTADYPSQHGSE